MFEGDLKALLLGSRPVPGKIEAFLNESIDIDRPMLTRAFARMLKHILDDGICPLAMLHNLVEISLQRVGDLTDLRAQLVVEFSFSK